MWERNRQVQDAVEKMKSDVEIIEQLGKTLSEELMEREKEASDEESPVGDLPPVDDDSFIPRCEDDDLVTVDETDDHSKGCGNLDTENAGRPAAGSSVSPRFNLPQDFVPRALLPQPLEQPNLQALRPSCELGQLHVGLERIGTTSFVPLPPLKRHRGMRGRDKHQRKPRMCALCIKFGGDDTAGRCAGRGSRKRCRCFTESGDLKPPAP